MPQQAPRGRCVPEIEEIASTTQATDDEDEEPMTVPDIPNLRPSYGFLQMFHRIFTDLARDGLAHEMLQLPHPDEAFPSDNDNNNDLVMDRREIIIGHRRQLRIQKQYNPGRYLGDMDIQDDYIFQGAMAMKPH